MSARQRKEGRKQKGSRKESVKGIKEERKKRREDERNEEGKG